MGQGEGESGEGEQGQLEGGPWGGPPGSSHMRRLRVNETHAPSNHAPATAHKEPRALGPVAERQLVHLGCGRVVASHKHFVALAARGWVGVGVGGWVWEKWWYSGFRVPTRHLQRAGAPSRLHELTATARSAHTAGCRTFRLKVSLSASSASSGSGMATTLAPPPAPAALACIAAPGVGGASRGRRHCWQGALDVELRSSGSSDS